MLLPGFEDSHVHPVEGGVDLGRCVLGDFTTEKQILDAVADYAAKNPTKPWVLGAGWQLPVFKDADPSKALLDAIVPDRPVFLDAADGHSAWVNSKALAIAGVTKATPDPPNGRIERDPATGEPSGTLREAAKGLVSSKIPPPSPEDRVEGLRRALAMANRFGITSLMEANADANDLDAYAELDRRGELTARVIAALDTDAGRGVAQVPDLVALRRKYQGPHLRANAVNIFADGVIESHTAALLEPYLGSNGDRGKANYEPEAMNQLVAALDREGFQVHVHAIGDRAIRMSLDAFERARAANGVRDSRHHIANLELIDPHDVPRFRALGVVANFQPLWAYPDTYITGLTVPVLGPERSRWLYPIASVAKTGAVVVCGSDWSVSSMNPLEAIQVAVTRRDPSLASGPAWIPEEVVDLQTMLAGYTINGAYVMFQERETGSVEVGKAADLVVLDRNLFETPPAEIRQAKVLLTLLEGREVYRDPGFVLGR
jgi:predicted amidohydrolase YtcJ